MPLKSKTTAAIAAIAGLGGLGVAAIATQPGSQQTAAQAPPQKVRTQVVVQRIVRHPKAPPRAVVQRPVVVAAAQPVAQTQPAPQPLTTRPSGAGGGGGEREHEHGREGERNDD